MKVICKLCGREYEYNKSKRQGHRKTVCRSCNVIKFRHQRKIKAVEYKGGKCAICGYNRCMRALVFHHIDETKKDFGFSYKGVCRNWELVKKELDKCVLVCSNCHMEIHEGLINIPG